MSDHARSDEDFAPQALRLYLQGTPFVRTLDALLAENQQLEEQRDTALRRIADWQAIAGSAKDENQRLREALEAIRDSTYDGRLDAEQFARDALAGDAE